MLCCAVLKTYECMNDRYTHFLVYCYAIGLPTLASRSVKTHSHAASLTD
jgi:hypothetical protein